MDLKSKIMGSIAAGAIGDAMGSATEQLTRQEVYETFGGIVDKMYKPVLEFTFAFGREAAQITDDSGQMFELIDAYVKTKGKITPQAVADGIVKWASVPENFDKFCGPSTRRAVLRFREGDDPVTVGAERVPMLGSSNGCAMKIAPAGLFNPGDIDAAIKDACIICQPTHATDIGMSAASATAAAVAEALKPDADLFSVYDACLYGAREGMRLAKTMGHPQAGPNVEARIKLAASIAIRNDDFEDTIKEIGEVIGAGLPAAEAVPAAIGLLIAARGDVVKTAAACSTVGDDTDTVAIIACCIAGALKGMENIPADLVAQVEKANDIKFKDYAEKVLKFV